MGAAFYSSTFDSVLLLEEGRGRCFDCTMFLVFLAKFSELAEYTGKSEDLLSDSLAECARQGGLIPTVILAQDFLVCTLNFGLLIYVFVVVSVIVFITVVVVVHLLKFHKD